MSYKFRQIQMGKNRLMIVQFLKMFGYLTAIIRQGLLQINSIYLIAFDFNNSPI